MLYEELTSKIIGAALDVHNELGFGFLESVYGNALYIELQNRGLKCDCQRRIEVYYKGKKVGNYVADMIVEDKVIVELKAVSEIRKEHQQQLLNYLVATNLELGLLLNFGHSLEKRRVINTPHKT